MPLVYTVHFKKVNFTMGKWVRSMVNGTHIRTRCVFQRSDSQGDVPFGATSVKERNLRPRASVQIDRPCHFLFTLTRGNPIVRNRFAASFRARNAHSGVISWRERRWFSRKINIFPRLRRLNLTRERSWCVHGKCFFFFLPKVNRCVRIKLFLGGCSSDDMWILQRG